jgi:glyoxylase-like metal-dependent hydrolase (beta-lactamase superfamily II)
MKRWPKIALWSLAVAIGIPLVLVGLVFIGFARTAPVADGTDLGGVRLIKGGFASVAAIDAGERAIVLVDAGSDVEGKGILAELHRRGLGPEAVKAILLTHGHYDHMAAIPLFPGAQVMALGAETDLIEGRSVSPSPVGRFSSPKPTGIRVGRALVDGETVVVGNLAVRVFAVPGHTRGSAAYLARGVLFLGDSADSSRDGKLEGAHWIGSESLDQDHASLRALAVRLGPVASEIRVIHFAHSGILQRGLAPLVEF